MKQTKSKGMTSKTMSKLHWTLRKKGMSYAQALRETGKLKKMSKHITPGKASWAKRKYPYLDFDGDGKVNKYDCQPMNKKKQDGMHEDMLNKKVRGQFYDPIGHVDNEAYLRAYVHGMENAGEDLKRKERREITKEQYESAKKAAPKSTETGYKKGYEWSYALGPDD